MRPVSIASVLCCCIGFVFGALGCGSADGNHLRIAMVTFAGYAPFYIADSRQLFDDVTVELIRIDDVPTIRAAMVSGDIDGYLATPDIALDTDVPPPGRAVWAIDQSVGGDGVVVSPDIGDLQDLRGKSIAAEPGLPPHFILLYTLFQNGMALTDVRFVDTPTQSAASAFAGGNVDAAGLYEPHLTLAAKARPGSRVVVSSKDVPGLIVDLVFFRTDVINERAASIEKVIVGWRRALAYIRDNREEANTIMAAAFDLEPDEFADIASGVEWLDLAANQELFGTTERPGPLFSSFQTVRDVLTKNRSSVYAASPDEYLLRHFISNQPQQVPTAKQ